MSPRSLLVVLVLLSAVAATATAAAASSSMNWPHKEGYHNHASTSQFMRNLDAQFQHLVRVYSIGKSENNKDLLVIELSSPPMTHDPPKRSVRLVGGIYGDEPVGRELLLNFAHFLATSYPIKRSAEQSPQLLDLMRIHILPTMNPDGSEVTREGTCVHGLGRFNVNGTNLDKNFPFNKTLDSQIQSETEAVINWSKKVPSVLSVTFRGGAYVVGYPYETRMTNSKTPHQNIAPDDDILQYLAHKFADNSPKIKNETLCNNKTFEGGIVNGAIWRKHGDGGLQDYSYATAGSMHLNVGVTCCKHPLASNLTGIWRENKLALLTLMAAAYGGINGVVRDAKTQAPIPGARIAIAGRSNIAFYSTKMKGTFSRILLPGNYKLEVSKEGYKSVTQRIEVNEEQTLFVDELRFTTHVGYVQVLLLSAREEPVNELTVNVVATEQAAPGLKISEDVDQGLQLPMKTTDATTLVTSHLNQTREEGDSNHSAAPSQQQQPTTVIIVLFIIALFNNFVLNIIKI